MPKIGPTLHVSRSTVVSFGVQLPIQKTGTLGSKTVNYFACKQEYCT